MIKTIFFLILGFILMTAFVVMIKPVLTAAVKYPKITLLLLVSLVLTIGAGIVIVMLF